MCRLLAVVSKQPTTLIRYFFETPKKFKDFTCKPIGYLGKIHNSGWGMGWYKGAKPAIFKEGKVNVANYDFEKVKDIRSTHLLAHVRNASVGTETTENAHPFQYNEWLFIHNGLISREKILPLLKTSYQKKLTSTTDSEVFFFLIMQYYEKTKDLLQALTKAVHETTRYPYKGLNIILTNGKELYAYRNVSPEAQDLIPYYTLFYRREKASIVISSEALTQDTWTVIQLGELITIDTKGNITATKLT